jgi:hypothetical protein
MMRLCRMTRFGQAELKRHLALGGTLPAPVGDEAGWYEPCPGGGNLESFLAWYDAGANRLERDDAKAVASFHRSFQPPRRVVCDSAFWAWLAAFPGSGYTEMRWRDKGPLSADRVGTKIWANAFARLWWAAEFTRVDQPAEILRVFRLEETLDPYVFAAMLVEDGPLETALLKRSLAQSRTVAVSFVGLAKELGPKVLPSEKMFELARRLHLAGSTTVIDAFDADRAAERPYAVSVRGARACREFLLELLRDPSAPATAPAKDVPPPTSPTSPTSPLAPLAPLAPSTPAAPAAAKRPAGLRDWIGGLFGDSKSRK